MKRRSFLKGLLALPAIAVVACKLPDMPKLKAAEPVIPNGPTLDDIMRAQRAMDEADVPADGRVAAVYSEEAGAIQFYFSSGNIDSGVISLHERVRA